MRQRLCELIELLHGARIEELLVVPVLRHDPDLDEPPDPQLEAAPHVLLVDLRDLDEVRVVRPCESQGVPADGVGDSVSGTESTEGCDDPFHGNPRVRSKVEIAGVWGA